MVSLIILLMIKFMSEKSGSFEGGFLHTEHADKNAAEPIKKEKENGYEMEEIKKDIKAIYDDITKAVNEGKMSRADATAMVEFIHIATGVHKVEDPALMAELSMRMADFFQRLDQERKK